MTPPPGTGAQVSGGLEHHLQPGAAGLRGFLAIWRDILMRSDFRLGCPVMAVAVEEPIDATAEEVLQTAAEVFGDWEDRLTTFMTTQGHAPDSASRLATLIIASVEGAIVLCRAQRSIEAFDRVAGELEQLVA